MNYGYGLVTVFTSKKTHCGWKPLDWTYGWEKVDGGAGDIPVRSTLRGLAQVG
jgi:hypothetical protein